LPFLHTASTEIYTLSLHDALPICIASVEGGTSFAAPLVTGTFALLKARNSRLAMTEYIDLVLDTASPAQPAGHGGNWAGAGILKIGRAHAELQSRENLVCRLLLEK